MIDAARALPLLRTAAESWEWRTPDSELPPWVRKAVARFAEWDTLIEAQIALLTTSTSPRCGRICRKAHEPAIPSTRSAMRSPPPSRRDTRRTTGNRFEQMIKNAAAQDWRTVDRLESDLDKASSPGQPQDRPAATDHRGGP